MKKTREPHVGHTDVSMRSPTTGSGVAESLSGSGSGSLGTTATGFTCFVKSAWMRKLGGS